MKTIKEFTEAFTVGLDCAVDPNGLFAAADRTAFLLDETRAGRSLFTHEPLDQYALNTRLLSMLVDLHARTVALEIELPRVNAEAGRSWP